MCRRSRKRSSCASGRAKVPSSSTGFCVASTRKGRFSGIVWPSTVICRSSIASSKADCVRGVARLISSANTICDRIGPGRNSNSPLFWLKMLTPVTSEGSRSGVNWMRWNSHPSARARDFASMVFPMPGTSSRRRWPSHSKATSASSMTSSLPTMTERTASRMRRADAATSPTSSVLRSVMSLQGSSK